MEDGEEACKYNEALELHLQNSEAKVRQKTVTFLGHLGEKAHSSHAAIVADRFQDSDPGIFAVTAVALARMGKPGAAALASQLGNGQPDIEQEVACEALGRMPNWQAAVQHLKSLTSRLQDQGNTRRAAAEAICRLTFLASNEAMNVCPDLPGRLVWSLRDSEASVRAAAATALAHLGEAGVGAFAEVLEQKMPSKDEEGSSRALETAAALYGFTHCSDELCCSKVDLILQRLDDPCKRVQLAAANTLKSLGPLCADSIAQKLKVEDPEERELFVIALGCIGSPNALPYTNMLVALLDSKNETSASVQVAAAEALAKCGPETGHAAAMALAELLSREGEDGQRKVAAAKNALISLKEVAAEVLPGLLSHKNPDVKCATFDILTSLGDGSGVLKELAACTSDANEKVRQQAVQALLLLKDPSVPLQILPRMMDDSDPTVAKLAISTIGKIGPMAVSLASVVAKQLKSTETDQRRAAACALGQLGELPSSTLKAIITQLRSEKNDEVKSALIQAIGSQGPGAGAFVSSLSPEFKEASVPVRHALLEAFGNIGEAAGEMAPFMLNLAMTEKEFLPQVIQAMGRVGEAAAFALSARMEDPDASVKVFSLEVLQLLAELPSTQEAVSAVMRALQDTAPEVQGAACLTAAMLAVEQVKQEDDLPQMDMEEQEDKLYQLKVESGLARRRGKDQASVVADKLSQLLNEASSPEVQSGALHGLWKLGANFSAPHAQVIASLANSSSVSLRKTAFLALGDFGEHAVPFVELMISHLGVEGYGQEVDLEVQLAVVQALTTMGMLGVEAAPLLAKRLIGTGAEERAQDPEEISKKKRMAPRSVASTLSPAEPSSMARRPGPRKSALDYEGWQLLPYAGDDDETPDEGLDEGSPDEEKAAPQGPSEDEVQRACVRALGSMGLPGAHTLTECFQYPDPELQAAMLSELRMVPEVHSAMINKLEDAYQIVRQAVVEFVFHLAEAGQVSEVLVPGLADEDPYVRHLHLQALGLLEHLAQDQAASVALRLRDPCWSVRACAVRTLHLIGPPAVPVLTSRLKDEDREMRAACVEGLGHLGDMASSSATEIVSSLADEEEIVIHQTFQTLKKIGTAGPEELATCIQSTKKPQVQLLAVQALGEFGKEAASYAPIIAGLLGCGVKKLEETAVNALKRMGVRAAVAVAPILAHRTPPVHDHENLLDDELQDAQKQRRLSAASALRNFGEEISSGQAQLVGTCLLDPDAEIRKEAVETLKILGEPGAATFSEYTDPKTGTRLEARVMSIEALGSLGLFAVPFIPHLAKCLQDPAAEVRRIAAVALGELAEEHSAAVADYAQEIAACLHDGDALTRRRCIECLGKLGNHAKPFVEEMVHILEGIDSWNWAPVAEALTRLGAARESHADILAANLTHGSRSVRWSAANCLGKLGDVAKDHVDALVNLLESEDASLRCVGTQTLMQVAKGINLEEKFLPLLMDPDTDTREQACLALASHCDGEGLEKLITKLHDPKPFVRRAAAATLGELGQEAADCAGDVLHLLFDSNSYVCATAARSLVAFGAVGAKSLMDRLLDDDEDDRLDVQSSVLQKIMLDAIQAADAQFIEPYLHVLVVFLAANQPEIRLAAWSCLSKVSDKGFQSLVKGANDSHIVVRKGVAEAIAFLLSGREPSDNPTYMEKEATETLAQQLTDPSDAVRVQAAEAFRRIGGPLAEAHSEDLAKRLQEHDIRVYCPVMDTLGAMGKVAAPYIALLKARLEVPEVKVRQSAVRALGRIGDPALPSAHLLVLRLEEDDNSEVKLCAVEALGEIGSASSQAAEQIAKVHSNCLASHMIMGEAPLRRACARTLGRLGPHASSCLHELVLALGDSDLEVRREAARALTGIGEAAAPEIVAIIRSVEDTVDLA